MAKSQKRYLVLLGFGLLVIIAAGVWMVFGRKTQIYEKTEEIFGNPLMGYAPCAWEETRTCDRIDCNHDCQNYQNRHHDL